VILPRGNVFIEGISLSHTDINIMLNNFEQDGFSGQVIIDIDKKSQGYIFFSHGSVISSIESVNNDGFSTVSISRMLNKVKDDLHTVSVYVYSNQIINILSNLFAYRNIYENLFIKKTELMKLIEDIGTSKLSCFMEAAIGNNTKYIFFEEGKLLIDNFNSRFGQVICGQDTIKEYLNKISDEGSCINIFGEEQAEIEKKKSFLKLEAEKIRQLFVKTEGRFLGKKDFVRVDESLFKIWGVQGDKTELEIENQAGKISRVSCVTGKKIEGFIVFEKSILKDFEVSEGEVITVFPLK
jgi:hypothetical protein